MIAGDTMKKAQDVDDLAGRLSEAAAAPLFPSSAPVAAVQDNRPAKATRKTGSVSVFLRLPADVHARLEGEAVARTKATGKGVTVQQVILDKLAREA
jgi:hypothetical protein